MNNAAQIYMATLEANGISVKETREYKDGETGVVCGLGMKNTNLDILAVFTEDNKYAWIRCFSFAKCSKDHLGQAMIVCNALNQQFKWVKFYVDEDGEFQAEDDAIIDDETAGEEVLELVFRMAKIVDDAYPNVMKAIYA